MAEQEDRRRRLVGYGWKCMTAWGDMAEEDGRRGLVGYSWKCMMVWDEKAGEKDRRRELVS